MRCEKCGFDYDSNLDRCPNCGASKEYSGNTMFYQRAKESKVKFWELFSGTFQRHPAGTAARVLIAGTPETTPTPDKMLAVWQKPWLYFRFFIAGILFVIIGYYVMTSINYGMVAVIGVLGAVIFPFAILMFIWEMNIPRDISFASVIAYFLIGGMLSLFITAIISVKLKEYDAPFAAFVEEPAKLLITLLLIHKAKTKYGFGGMLLGAAVGAGFTVFENICYIYNFFIEGTLRYGIDAGVFLGRTVLLERSFDAYATHTVWAAIVGAGAVLGRKGKDRGFGYLKSPVFWICFSSAIVMHFLWNGGWNFVLKPDEAVFDEVYKGFEYFLTFAAIAILFVLVNKCLKQVLKAYDDARSVVLNIKPSDFSEPVSNVPVNYAESYAELSPESNTPCNMPDVVTDETPESPSAEQPEIAKENVKTHISVIRSDYLSIVEQIDRVINIGRDSSYCDIVFPPETPGVSRKHCAVMTSSEGVVYVMDLGSSNGTFLFNGTKLSPNEWTPVDKAFYVASEKYMFYVE